MDIFLPLFKLNLKRLFNNDSRKLKNSSESYFPTFLLYNPNKFVLEMAAYIPNLNALF
jgi:hypothetical protein